MESPFEDRIQNAKDLDFGTIFNQSIELFKKVWLQGLIVIVLTIALIIPFYILMYMPLIALGIMDPGSFENGNDPSVIFIVPFILFMFVFVFCIMVIAFALKAAFYRICMQKDLNIKGSDDYFYFFKSPHLMKVMKLSAASVLISFIAMLLCAIPLIYASVPIAFIMIVFAFNPEISVSDIIRCSFNLGNKKWLISFGLMIIAGILAQIVGVIMCFVGIFVTASFAYIPLYFVYKEVIGFEKPDEHKQIENI